jgi:hypothetical protein
VPIEYHRCWRVNQVSHLESGKPQLVTLLLADNYPPSAHNQSMNKNQSRWLLLTTDHCSLSTEKGTPPLPLIPTGGMIIFPKTLQIISLA